MKLEEYGCPIEVVYNVGDYINLINTNDGFLDCNIGFYRGESKDYGNNKLTASGLRDKNCFSYGLYEYFYKRTFSRLSLNEKDNFIAFCQHHGIPTNLLDITSNPLTALYFACDGNDKDDGYIYAFRVCYNIVNDLVDSFNITNINTQLNSLCSKEKYNKYISDIISFERYNISFDTSKPVEDIEKYIEDLKTKSGQDLFRDELVDELVSIMPISIYQPLLSFERAIAQHSMFIFQWHSQFKYQILKPSFIIRIPAEVKLYILENLDDLDINRATVYQDFDSIAQYIKEKHGYK